MSILKKKAVGKLKSLIHCCHFRTESDICITKFELNWEYGLSTIVEMCDKDQ
jgi:hypothetical protein